MIESFWDYLLVEWEQFVEFLPRVVFGIVVILLFYLLGKFISRLYDSILSKTTLSETSLQYFQKLIVGVAIFIGFVFFLHIIGFSSFANTLLAGGGLTAVMLGFAFRDIGENLLAGFFLAFSRPFNKGDLIESEGLTGRVQIIQLRYTHIRSGDGCDIFIPSSQLFSKPLHNYTLDGLRRGLFTIGIDYADNVEEACTLLHKTVKNVSKILKQPAPVVSIKGFDPNYVLLQVGFWVNVRDQESTLPRVRSNAMEACRLVLLDQGYTFSA
ncbi:MAG: mechanosensitive ion channel domain-containing protein, partial [Balneolaceae bacterium]